VKKRFLFALILFFLAGCASSAEQETPSQGFNSIKDEVPLKLILSTEKSVYKVGESIMATLRLENVSKEPIYVKKRMFVGALGSPIEFRDVFFLIDGSFSPRIHGPELSDTDFGYLNPGDGFENSWDLVHLYLLDDPGVYYVAAIYQNSHDPENGPPSWRGEIRSNTISLEIINP